MNMKRYFKWILVLCLICSMLVGCDDDLDDYRSVVYKSTNHIEEWVSPDGVHYWIYKHIDWFGIAPRYDSNGNLIIDGR